MPLYEGIGIVAEKHSVILDIGTAYTKCGFARENGPRCIIPTMVKDIKTGKCTKILEEGHDKTVLEKLLKEFLHMLYFKYLVINPKDRRVVVVESIYWPILFRNCLANILFTHFEVPSVLFIHAQLASLFTLGINTGLVMDCGYRETVVLPICEGISLLFLAQSLPVGAQSIHSRIKDMLLKCGSIFGDHSERRPLSSAISNLDDEILEDIKVRGCFIAEIERGRNIQVSEMVEKRGGNQDPEAPTPAPDVDYPLDGHQILTIPGKIIDWAPEILFEMDKDGNSLATLILDAILKAPIDIRRVLADNVILMGGTSMLPNFKARLLAEVKYLLSQPPYKEKLSIEGIKLHTPPAKENYVAWLGAAIVGSTDTVTLRGVSKEQFLQSKHIPDWSDQGWLLGGS